MIEKARQDALMTAFREALTRLRILYAGAEADGMRAELAAIAGALQQALDNDANARSEAGQVRLAAEIKLRGHGRRAPLLGSLLIQMWLREGGAILSDQGLAELTWLLETNSSEPSPRH
jgi:hypothetical protein